MNAWLVAAGAILSGPIWVAATLWAGRRIWRTAHRLAARTRGQEHLLELGQLVGGLAHEIKNPLSTINLNLKLLAEDLDRYPDEMHGRWLRRLKGVQDEANRLKNVLDDFLRFAGRFELTPETVDIRRLVDEMVVFFAPQAEAARVVMRTSLPDSPVVCKVDVGLLKQAVLNLVINAVQAMEAGGELIIAVGSDRGSGTVEVIDTGPGIAPKDLPRIFEVYYSTRKGGTGLGLPIIRRIVREHGGAIRAESDLGKGTRFVISLPLAKS